MLIHPKHIYNFCSFHAYIGDIAICFASLSYLLQHIWTNLLTHCPSASFCLLLSVHFRKMSNINVLGKIQKNHIKNKKSGRLQRPRVGSRQLAAWSGGGGDWCPPF